MGVRFELAAAITAVLLSASSCSGNDSPGTLPPTTPPTSPVQTTTPTPSPTPPPPTLPALATQDSAAGAESFARFYLTLLDYANHTGVTQTLRTLGICSACKAQADGIDRFFREGGRIEGGRITVESSKDVGYVKMQAAIVNVVYSQEEGRAIDAGGRTEQVSAQLHVKYTFTLRWTGRQWLVTKLQPLA